MWCKVKIRSKIRPDVLGQGLLRGSGPWTTAPAPILRAYTHSPKAGRIDRSLNAYPRTVPVEFFAAVKV